MHMNEKIEVTMETSLVHVSKKKIFYLYLKVERELNKI